MRPRRPCLDARHSVPSGADVFEKIDKTVLRCWGEIGHVGPEGCSGPNAKAGEGGPRVPPGAPGTWLRQSPAELEPALAGAVRASIADGAQAVIIGGGPLTASALLLQPQFDIPLIVPVIAAAKAAAAAVTAN